jgi:gentisate 1,2-dioxygenase
MGRRQAALREPAHWRLISRGEQEWRYRFGPRDHFVVPSWHTARLSSDAGCVLFSFSDRPVHDALGIHNEERLS